MYPCFGDAVSSNSDPICTDDALPLALSKLLLLHKHGVDISGVGCQTAQVLSYWAMW